jgi:peptidoglycan/xylan/chitin deacetylase (PgdA/CDA1 family)
MKRKPVQRGLRAPLTSGPTARPALRWAVPLLGVILLSASCARGPKAGSSAAPPTPQFVCFSSDDNGYSGLPGSGSEGGLHWLKELFQDRYRSTIMYDFDGPPLHFTFYVNTFYLDPLSSDAGGRAPQHRDNAVYIKRAWREAVEAGHEIGVHTHSHPHGRGLTVAQWEEEIDRSIRILTAPWNPGETPERPDAAAGIGLARTDLVGFRAPFIEPSDNGMTAARAKGFLYDSSIEEVWRTGGEAGGDVEGFRPPYRLDAGLPDVKPPIGPQPGIWEIPIYDYLTPSDAECVRYGLAPGFRARLKAVKDYFLPEYGGITGMDWNLWNEFNLTPDEFLAVLKYSFDRRYESDRRPMTVGLHSALYTVTPGMPPERAALVRARRAAVEAFFDYVISRPDVRAVSQRELLDWLMGRKDPPRPGYAPGGFLDEFESPELVIDPEGANGWGFLAGEGRAVMNFRKGVGFSSITIDATKDRRNVWWAFIKRRVSENMNLALLADPRCELRIEARVRASRAPRRINLHLNTQRTTDFHSHLMEFDLPRPDEWRTVSMTTRSLPLVDFRPGDTVNGQLALMDWGLGTYRLDVGSFRVDIVDVTAAGPGEGEPIPYHPSVADPRSFTHALQVAQDGIIDAENPDVSLGRWRVREKGQDAPLVAVGGTISTILRWDFSPFAGRKAAGSGLLELTTRSVEGLAEPPPDFGRLRVVEILGGDPAWMRESVTWNGLLGGAPADDVLNPQMIIDWPPAEGDGSKTYLTIPRPVLQRLIDGAARGIAIRPLGALHAAFYSREYDSGRLAARLLFNTAD